MRAPPPVNYHEDMIDERKQILVKWNYKCFMGELDKAIKLGEKIPAGV